MPNTKAFWLSKTLWFNLLTGAAALAGVIPLEPQTAAVVVAVINIGLRLITVGPVTVVKDAAGR